MKLTDVTIRALPLQPTGNAKHWDDNLPGFGVRCTAKSKSFIVMYGKDRRLKTIGRYPQISLREARAEAKRILALKPSKTRIQATPEAVRAYLEDAETRLRPNTLREYTRHLLKAPDRPLDAITKKDIDLNDPQAIKSWKVFYNWCIRNELTERNPFQHVPVVFGQRSRVLTPDELRQVWQYTWPPYSDYIKLLILTGQRRGQFQQYEVQDDTLYFPAEIMKTKVEHQIPATPLVLELIDRLEPFNGWSKAKQRMDLHIGLTGWVPHDLRRTFSTIHASLGTPLHVTERILAHRSGTISGVAAIYNRHTYMPEMREALTRYEQHVLSIVA